MCEILRDTARYCEIHERPGPEGSARERTELASAQLHTYVEGGDIDAHGKEGAFAKERGSEIRER